MALAQVIKTNNFSNTFSCYIKAFTAEFMKFQFSKNMTLIPRPI